MRNLQFYSSYKSIFYKQTVWNLIRHCDLWHLICFCTVFQSTHINDDSLKWFRQECPSMSIWNRPRGYKTRVHSQPQNKAQWLAACGNVSTISQSLCFILSLRLYSSFITSRQGKDLVWKLWVTQDSPFNSAFYLKKAPRSFWTRCNAKFKKLIRFLEGSWNHEYFGSLARDPKYLRFTEPSKN